MVMMMMQMLLLLCVYDETLVKSPVQQKNLEISLE